ncbi:hypothetical protein ACFE04_016328 [Oxalis oulophora]
MNETEMSIPHLFRCPITLDLLQDPVTLSTGQTYDRSSIQKWLAAGNLTCPVTMQKLHDPSLVPNNTLRHLIHQWLPQQMPLFDFAYSTKFDYLATLKQKLQSNQVSLDIKLQILDHVFKESPCANSCLMQLGFLPLLLNLLFQKVDFKFISLNYSIFVEQTLACVLKLLALGELDSLNMLKKESNLECFLNLFEEGNNSIKKSLCHIIETISTSLELKDLCLIIGRNQKLLSGLTLVIHQSSDIAESGIKAVSGLCSLESNRDNLIEQGAIDGLVSYISNSTKHEKNLSSSVAISILERLLPGNESEITKNPSRIVKALVKMVFKVCDHEGSESAVNCLVIICGESLKAREEAIGEGVLSQLLLVLQSQCGIRTKTKARTLLKLLRSKWAEEHKLLIS